MDLFPHDSDLVLERGTIEHNGTTVRYCVFQIAPEQWVATGTSSDSAITAGVGASARDAIASLARLIEDQEPLIPSYDGTDTLVDDGGVQPQ